VPKRTNKNKAPVEPRIESAVGNAGGSGESASQVQSIEAAMSRAIQEAAADGVTDPVEIRERMLRARDAVLRG
jgi:hypothetical protein